MLNIKGTKARRETNAVITCQFKIKSEIKKNKKQKKTGIQRLPKQRKAMEAWEMGRQEMVAKCDPGASHQKARFISCPKVRNL